MAVVAVALCVWMVLTTVSIFDGFLQKTETAARSLFGEVIVDADSLSGIARYDEFIVYLKKNVPEVEAATPVIYSYGIIRVGPTFTETVQVCGIRLPQRQEVAGFKGGMMVQDGNARPTFDPPIELMSKKIREHQSLVDDIFNKELKKPDAAQNLSLLERLSTAQNNSLDCIGHLAEYKKNQPEIARLRADLAAEESKPPEKINDEKVQSLRDQLRKLETFRPDHMILGVGISGLSFRTEDGETVRTGLPGMNIVLTLLPLGRGGGSMAALNPNTRTFTVVDDARTDVYSIDSKSVYVPFELLQDLADMGEIRDKDDPRKVDPARCSQIQIKIRPEFTGDRRLLAVRDKIDLAWFAFAKENGQLRGPYSRITVQTWRQKLAHYISTVENQRTMVAIIFGIMAMVSVILIFAVFYMIVTQKIRDIGILRATGASSPGIAQIFLAFGSITGLAGSAIGVLIAYLTVTNINAIQDWVAAVCGFRVWNREVFLFDKIPNEVNFSAAVVIVIWAMAAGLIGAMIPSVRAATMEPVEAIRYE